MDFLSSKTAYFYTYKANVKLRWVNRSIIDVLESEFVNRDRNYYLGALAVGVITVNDKITCPSHKLQPLDLIKHVVHAHEPPQPKIEVIAEENDYLIVDKPAGIPCHPVGAYHFYSVTESLFPEIPVGCVNRLDMPVSGVLILALKNRSSTHNLLLEATKIYVAKVRGKFHDQICVDQPIGDVGSKIMDVTQKGKPSKTIFTLLKYENGYSLIQCQPITGRTHQIRVHLKYLGFPILNDILYGNENLDVCDSDKKNFGFDCDHRYKTENLDIGFCNGDFCSFSEQFPESSKEIYDFVIKNCKGIKNRTFAIKDSYICLHAWKYTFGGKTYEAEWPGWARNF